MVRVSLCGQGMGQGGQAQPPQDSGRRCSAWGQHRMGAGKLPCQIPSCRCQHASTVGLGGSLEAEEGVTWLPRWLHILPESLQHRSQECAGTWFFHMHLPVRCWLLFFTLLSPILGYPPCHWSSQSGEASHWSLHQCFCRGCSSLHSALGKMWCPDAAAQTSVVRDSPA